MSKEVEKIPAAVHEVSTKHFGGAKIELPVELAFARVAPSAHEISPIRAAKDTIARSADFVDKKIISKALYNYALPGFIWAALGTSFYVIGEVVGWATVGTVLTGAAVAGFIVLGFLAQAAAIAMLILTLSGRSPRQRRNRR